MTVEQIWSIVASFIVSAGGIGGIIVAFVKFSSEIIAKRLEEKYSFKMSKALENHKAMLDGRTYISKALFDREFELYQSLCNKFYAAYSKLNILRGVTESGVEIIPRTDICLENPALFDLKNKVDSGTAVTELAVQKLKSEIGEKLLEYSQLLNEAAAFIPYDNQKLFLDMGNSFQTYLNDQSENNFNNLLALRSKMQVELRKYLENLSIIE